MTSAHQQPSPQLPPFTAPGPVWNRPAQSSGITFLDHRWGGLLVLGGLLLVALIALLDYGTDLQVSFGIIYLIPVAACAWWGGFPHGILLSLAAAMAWHGVDVLHAPAMPLITRGSNDIVRFGTLILVSSLLARLRVAILREHLLARTDSLTGAANGRTFYEVAATKAELAVRNSRPLTLAYIDLDNFKQLNDQLGHAAGDLALLHVVQTICGHLRGADLLARLGGDEFALLLPDTEAEAATALLARVHAVVSQEMTRQGWPVSLSIGAITYRQPSWDVDRMIQQADAVMYGAKQKGKGRVEHMVVVETQECQAEEGRCLERRATARLLCNWSVRVRRQGETGAEQFATVRDISAGGIRLLLTQRMPQDAVLMIEPFAQGAKVLLARVVYATPAGGRWMHGCELSPWLSAEEIRGWLGESLNQSSPGERWLGCRPRLQTSHATPGDGRDPCSP